MVTPQPARRDPSPTLQVAQASELLRQAASFGEAVYTEIYGVLHKHCPSLVPDTIPPSDERSLATATDKVIRRLTPSGLLAVR